MKYPKEKELTLNEAVTLATGYNLAPNWKELFSMAAQQSISTIGMLEIQPIVSFGTMEQLEAVYPGFSDVADAATSFCKKHKENYGSSKEGQAAFMAAVTKTINNAANAAGLPKKLHFKALKHIPKNNDIEILNINRVLKKRDCRGR